VLLWVWIGVAVLAVLVLGVLGYGLLGAVGRLSREFRALDREVRPLLTEVQATAERAAALRAPEQPAP
jgi:hypothetical protein